VVAVVGVEVALVTIGLAGEVVVVVPEAVDSVVADSMVEAMVEAIVLEAIVLEVMEAEVMEEDPAEDTVAVVDKAGGDPSIFVTFRRRAQSGRLSSSSNATTFPRLLIFSTNFFSIIAY